MSSANLELSRSASRKSLGLVSLLLLSSLSAVLIVPTASAVSGDYEITESLSPMPGQYLEPYEQLYIEVKITNTGFFNIEFSQTHGCPSKRSPDYLVISSSFSRSRPLRERCGFRAYEDDIEA